MTEIKKKLVSSSEDILALIENDNADALFGDDLGHVSKIIKQAAWKSRKLNQSSDRKPAISVYGPSQAGKSFLASVLVRPSEKPLEISFPGSDGNKEFISDINPGGEGECTGLVTRFTLNSGHKNKKFPVLLRLLTEIDLICILMNSYFRDGDQSHEIHKNAEEIGSYIEEKSATQSDTCDNLNESDFWELEEYLQENFSNFEYTKTLLPFVASIATQALKTKDITTRANLYAPFWGFHKQFTELFTSMVEVLSQTEFSTELHVGINSLVPKSKSIIDVLTLKNISSGSDDKIDVQTPSGKTLKVGRALLSAITAELILDVSEVPHKFMEHTDVLDFPGTKNRMPAKLSEHFAGFEENGNDIHSYLKRGKVAYLFEKYVNAQDINAMLLCIKNSNMESVGLPPLVERWVTNSIGATPEARRQRDNSLFFIMTFFDQHLSDHAANEKENDRFSKRIYFSLLEIFGKLPDSWPNNWDGLSDHEAPFNNCYWLRNPGVNQQYFKRDEQGKETIEVTKGDEKRISEIKKMYLQTPKVKSHFADPELSWEAVMQANDGGTTYILNNLAKICKPNIKSVQLDDLARTLFQELERTLRQYHVPTDFGARQSLNRQKIDLLGQEITELMKAQSFAEFLEAFHISSEYLQARTVRKFTTRVSTVLEDVCQIWFDKVTSNSKNISQRYPISKASVEFLINEVKLSIARENLSNLMIEKTKFLDFGGADQPKKVLALEIAAFIINDFVSLSTQAIERSPSEINLSGSRENIEVKFFENWLINFTQKVEGNMSTAGGTIRDQNLNEQLGKLVKALET